MHNKGNHKQSKQTTYKLGEKFANDVTDTDNFKNIQRPHTALYKHTHTHTHTQNNTIKLGHKT